MCKYLLAYFTLLSAVFGKEVLNAGFEVHLTEKGLNLLSDYSHDLISNYLFQKKSHHFEGSYGDSVKFELEGLKLKDKSLGDFTTKVTVEPGYGLVWKIGDLSLNTESRYNARYKSLSGSGTIQIKIYHTTVILQVSGEPDEHGKLKADLDDCHVYIRLVKVHFPKTSWSDRILNFISKPIERMAKNLMQSHLCHKFREDLLPGFKEKLLQVETSVRLFDDFYLNYGLIDVPQFDDEMIKTKHSGAVYGIVDKMPDTFLPFKAPPLFAPLDTDKMLYLYMSNHTVASLLYWMNKMKHFDYEFSQDTVEEKYKNYFKTDCGALGICAGSLFPSLSKIYPESFVEILLKTTQYPTVEIEDNFVNVTTRSTIEGLVGPLDSEKKETFLKARIDLYSQIKKFQLEDFVLKGKLELDNFVLFDIDSNIKEIDAQSIDLLISSVVDFLLRPDLIGKLESGIHLPKLLNFKMKEGKIQLKKHLIVLSSDFCKAGPDCKESVKKNTSKITENVEDYYNYYHVIEP